MPLIYNITHVWHCMTTACYLYPCMLLYGDALQSSEQAEECKLDWLHFSVLRVHVYVASSPPAFVPNVGNGLGTRPIYMYMYMYVHYQCLNFQLSSWAQITRHPPTFILEMKKGFPLHQFTTRVHKHNMFNVVLDIRCTYRTVFIWPSFRFWWWAGQRCEEATSCPSHPSVKGVPV